VDPIGFLANGDGAKLVLSSVLAIVQVVAFDMVPAVLRVPQQGASAASYPPVQTVRYVKVYRADGGCMVPPNKPTSTALPTDTPFPRTYRADGGA